MPGSVVYLDTSALVKLVVAEAESSALRVFLGDRPLRATSVIAEVELRRAARRVGREEEVDRRALAVIGGLHLIELDSAVRQIAATLDPVDLRSLDSIHVASAIGLGDSLSHFVAYDNRVFKAGQAHSLVVLAPGASLPG